MDEQLSPDPREDVFWVYICNEWLDEEKTIPSCGKFSVVKQPNQPTKVHCTFCGRQLSQEDFRGTVTYYPNPDKPPKFTPCL